MYDPECEGEIAMNYTTEREQLWKRIEGADKFYIYGAQIVAYGVYKAISEVLGKYPKAFLVSSKVNNPTEIDSIPVSLVSGEINTDALIIVATPEIYHDEIKEILENYKLNNLLFVDSHVEYLIMSKYFQKLGTFKLLEDLPFYKSSDELPGVKMFMAKHHRDKRLKGQYDIPSWVIPIQVGASLTDLRITELLDNTGDNISNKNYKYSELTAMYWAWKNIREEYLGICHYRRILLLDTEDLIKIKQNNINVVLPLPFVCYPDASGQYGRYISAEDQEKLMEVLKETDPEYYRAALKILKGPYLYNYNMFLADSETFNEYCNWIFPVLKRAEELCEPSGQERTDRYLGYFAEVLTALYFLYNKNNLKIVHGEKKWMV
ncbi:uncharacterized protein DUF4422 [Herbinix hemicellulosilytica]|uniref:DUF4422 domain-containing protein n=2 Tax=Herbinix hemicellulosilytica TaxID=1564487 RepID=A0A0H5SK84_HERHM|nr:DUF4422 domain-containing protein [Herbinix hemicellulosilytica]RBP59803.1 uncharacterized protein DUF4422 [Herbinix hemicellulosilytica]CRZ35191.1 hypothetical protein HHT355_1993 [Herbinix hemicellulosilytica]